MLRRIVIIKLQKNFVLLLSELKIFESTVRPKNKRLEGGGRKPLDLQLKSQLL